MTDKLINLMREFASLPEHCENVADCDQCPKEDICNIFANKQVFEVLSQAADALEELQGWNSTLSETVAMLMKQIAELGKPKWIPVTEMLPEYGDWVLGIGPKKGYHVCEYRGKTHFPYSGDIPWFSAKGRSLTITHWMPLPEPPKEDPHAES